MDIFHGAPTSAFLGKVLPGGSRTLGNLAGWGGAFWARDRLNTALKGIPVLAGPGAEVSYLSPSHPL